MHMRREYVLVYEKGIYSFPINCIIIDTQRGPLSLPCILCLSYICIAVKNQVIFSFCKVIDHRQENGRKATFK